MNRNQRAFTIIELLVVVSIIALLVGILLPAIGKARDQAKLTQSQANMRNLAAAHQSYAAEWGDRQYTAIDDNISQYGRDWQAFQGYNAAHGSSGALHDPGNHPPIYLGYGHTFEASEYRMYAYKMVQAANAGLAEPINFEGFNQYFGSFRLPNALQFNQYVSGRFYDKVFYAPKDKTVIESVGQCFESPDQYCTYGEINTTLGEIPVWSSYCSSPAAMFNPQVMGHDDPEKSNDGWRDPWDISGGFRSPSFSQALYPNLKTHMLEHHWLQNNNAADCNPSFDPGSYLTTGCEPYYFNHAWESSPVTLFYDGHVESVGVRNTMRADGRVRAQTGSEEWGLWCKDTPWGVNGYLSDAGYDRAETSFHILTTDGIRGRDVSAN